MARIWRIQGELGKCFRDAMEFDDTFALCSVDDSMLTLNLSPKNYHRLCKVMIDHPRYAYVCVWKKFVFPLDDKDFSDGWDGLNRAFEEAAKKDILWKFD